MDDITMALERLDAARRFHPILLLFKLDFTLNHGINGQSYRFQIDKFSAFFRKGAKHGAG